MSTIRVSPSTRLYATCKGGGPGKTLGELTDETVFEVKRYKPGEPYPYLIGGKYASELGWVSI